MLLLLVVFVPVLLPCSFSHHSPSSCPVQEGLQNWNLELGPKINDGGLSLPFHFDLNDLMEDPDFGIFSFAEKMNDEANLSPSSAAILD
jgi:hypothetical protein